MLLITGNLFEAAITKQRKKGKDTKVVRSESNVKMSMREIKADLINGGETVIDRIDQKERDHKQNYLP